MSRESGTDSAVARHGEDLYPLLSETARALVERIGDTPLVPLPSPVPGMRLLGKLEGFNPGGSVKDRTAWGIVREGLRRGELPRRRLLDASSGNTAVAYAMLGAACGFDVTLCVPENASPERIRTLEAYGADLVRTDPLEGSDGAIRQARRLAREEGDRFWYADQYDNPANPRIHFETTGPEIWRHTGGEVTHLVAGLGTTGTVTGTGRFLRERNPDVAVVGVEPAGPLHGIEGLKHLGSALRPGIFREDAVDRRVRIETEEAQERARRLARTTGLFLGISSGAAVAAAVKLARQADGGAGGEAGEAVVVAILPDGGDRYLSEEWWSR